MSTTSREVVEAPRTDDMRPRRLTFEDTLRMAEAGILGDHERVELLDGQLVEMTPEGVEHADVLADIATRLAQLYPAGFQMRPQNPMPLGEHTYVEPDVVVRRRTARGWPTPDQVVLVVEVAQSSAARDRTDKLGRYAAWGVPEYWIVDLNRREVLVHTEPKADRYMVVRTVRDGALEPPGSGGSIRLDEVLPPVEPGPASEGGTPTG